MPTHPHSVRDRLRTTSANGRSARRRRPVLEGLEPRLAPAAPAATISGVVYDDLNNNGIQDGSDFGIGGRTVFFDLNQDGVLDNGEPTTTSSASGTYQFTDVQPGTYLVGQALPTGWTQSATQGTAETQATISPATQATFTFASLASTTDQSLSTDQGSGYTFSASNGFEVYGSQDAEHYAGATALTPVFKSAPGVVVLKRDDGAPFTLPSIDLSTDISGLANAITFTATTVDGGKMVAQFATGHQLGFQTVNFSGFTDVTSVSWVENAGNTQPAPTTILCRRACRST